MDMILSEFFECLDLRYKASVEREASIKERDGKVLLIRIRPGGGLTKMASLPSTFCSPPRKGGSADMPHHRVPRLRESGRVSSKCRREGRS